MAMAHLLLILNHLCSMTRSVTDIFTTWSLGSPSIPDATRGQAGGYDPYTGIIYLLGGAGHSLRYFTYNTITKEMSSSQYFSNGGQIIEYAAQHHQQIHRTVYLYDWNAQCIDTFDMESSTYTSCWASLTSLPQYIHEGCLAIDDTARYFYIIPETDDFFFYDSVEQIWYTGPETVQSAHLFAGCDVFNDKLYYFGGQQCWGSCAGLRTIEYLDISDMDALKQDPTSFSWSTMTDFLPVTPEAAFVRNIQLNDIIYTVAGYRFSGDGTNVDVMCIDLTNNQVDVLTEIPTRGSGGTLVWDSCQMQLYYFGGYDGSSDLTSWYYSNTVSNQYLPAKHKMDCKISEFITTTTTTAITTTTSIETTTSTTDAAKTSIVTTAAVESTSTTTTSTEAPPHATTKKESDITAHVTSTSPNILIKTTLLNDTYTKQAPKSSNVAVYSVVSGSIIFFVGAVAVIVYIFYCKNKNKPSESMSLMKPAPTPNNPVAVNEMQTNAPGAVSTQVMTTDIASKHGEEDILPYEWVKLYSNGRAYYQNNRTKQTQWAKPTVTQTELAPVTTTSVILSTQPSAPSLPNVSEETAGAGLNHGGFNKNDTVAVEIAAPSSVPLVTGIVAMGEKEGVFCNEMDANANGHNINETGEQMKYQDVKDFFEDMNFSDENKAKYYTLFISNGFDHLDVVKTILNKDLLDIGVSKLGHRKMILKKLQYLRLESPIS